ncbi:MAG: hypothetical protein CL878_05405 [Dehalococcoidia bacterium]|nr:hypothetical protein [Dehalococcoidia bacterium]
MQRKKQKRKASRRALRLVERAWAAVDAGDLGVACKEMGRSLKERQDNPAIWNDYGLILELAGDGRAAEEAFRTSTLIAPTFAEAYANYARVVARRGASNRALGLVRKALALEPGEVRFQEQLEDYAVLAPEVEPLPELPEPRTHEPVDPTSADEFHLGRYDWDDVADTLTARGCCVLPGLLSADACTGLVVGQVHDDRFEKTVRLEGPTGCGGDYRFFRRPLPPLVRALRSAVYARIVPVVNDWQDRLGEMERYPSTHPQFEDYCAREGQTRPTPILLRYSAPAVNHLHRDVWGRVAFPLQLAVTRSPRAAIEGGHFVLTDEGPGRRARRRELATDLGDGVLFATRHRLVRIGGAWGLQSVAHGMSSLVQGERYVLGCPFHDYK